MTQEKIQRINELYRKSQAEGLSEAEKKEQDLLRKEYIASVKKNLRNQLNNIDMVNTDEYFAYLINKAKRIYYPRVSGDEMSFYRVRSLDELNCGSFNINEPDMTHEYTEADGRALMIVPGLGFSYTGYRIGYGKGFYDRYLSSFTKRDTVMAVGVGYDFQLLGNVTFEDEYDVPLDGVITDKREVFIDD